jgi:predicted nucleic acid-binding protein
MCLQHYTVLDLDRDIAWTAGQLARQLRGSGQAIGENDVWIAATALHHRLPVVTNNVQHFQRITGLQVVVY